MPLRPELIASFSEGVLNARYDSPKPTPDFHLKLWEYCCSPHKQVAVAAPRGHAKSTAGNFAYPLTSLLFGYKDFVLILSNTERQAQSFLMAIYQELVDNEILKEMFGPFKFHTESKGEIIVETKGGRLFAVQARGAGQSLRGTKWGAKRPDLIVFDDVEDDDSVSNNDRREDFRKWVYNTVLPAMSDTGEIRVFGTILHLDSMLENMMPEYQVPDELDKNEYLVKEPLSTYCTYEGDDLDWHSIRFRAHDKEFEHILWPSKFSEARLKKIQLSYFRRGIPEGYAQEYLNYPIDDSTAYFRSQDFLEYKDHGKEILNYYIGVDFAVTEKNRADYTVFVVCGRNSDGFLVVVDVIRDRMDALQIEEWFTILQKRYNPEFFAVEKGTIWNSLKPAIERGMMVSDRFMNMLPIAMSQDKMSRGRSIQNRMRAGAVKFMKNREWYPSFEEELTRFPKDLHDDQVDAFSIIGLALGEQLDAPTKEEVMIEQYESELSDAEDEGYVDTGFCIYTGY